MIRECSYSSMVINLWNLLYRLTKTQIPPSHFFLVFAFSVIMSSDEIRHLSSCVSIGELAGEGEENIVWKIVLFLIIILYS